MGLFGGSHGWGGGGGLAKRPPLPKIFHIYLPKADPKIYESCDTPLEFC